MTKALVLLIAFVAGCLTFAGGRSAESFGSNRIVRDAMEKSQKSPARPKRDRTAAAQDNTRAGVEMFEYGQLPDGTAVRGYDCTTTSGTRMRLMDYGATMISLEMPDRDGKLANVIATCKDLDGFLAGTSYFNAIAGRYANRIAAGKFSIDGREFQLATNNGDHHLHGGERGFDKRLWSGEPVIDETGCGVRFSYVSEDGEEGYPGKLSCTATYMLNNHNELSIEITATTDAATHVNLTNHNYWNLHGSGDILGHELKLHAGQYLPVDAGGIPEGDPVAVDGTPFDFTRSHPIGRDFESFGSDPGGIDHCYVLNGESGQLRPAARLYDPASGRWMEMWTTEPGLQVYTGNYLDGGAGSCGYQKNGALCLESEHFPDTPNRSDFPTTLLKPGETYSHLSVMKFGVEKQAAK